MIGSSLSSLLVLIPEMYLVIMAFLFMIIVFFQDRFSYSQNLVLVDRFIYVTLLVFLLALLLVYSLGNASVEAFGSLFLISPTVYIFKIFIIIVFILYLLVVKNNLIENGIANKIEYLIILILLLATNMLLISSNDFLSMYVTLEATALCTYIIIFMNQDNKDNLQAGLKYFLISMVGTAFLLFGISYIYGFTGSTSFSAINSYLEQSNNNWLVVLSLVFIVVGLGFKLSLVPFHAWTGDIYKGVDWSSTLLLSSIGKISALFILIRVLGGPFAPIYHSWLPIMQVLIVATTVVGYLAMLLQTNLKRFVAYSSIANMGYILLGALFITTESIQHILVYFIVYIVSLFGFVGLILMLRKPSNLVEEVSDLAGLAKKYPYLGFALVIFILSLAGLPITAGFFSKFLILLSAFNNNFYVVPSIVILVTVVSLAYYFKLISTLYSKSASNSFTYNFKQNQLNTILIVGLLLVTLLFIFFLNPLLSLLQNVIFIVW